MLTDADITTVNDEFHRLKKVFVRSIPGTERALLVDHFRLHYLMLRVWCEEICDKGTRDTRAPAEGKKVQVTSVEGADLALELVLNQLDDLLLFMETHLSEYIPQPEYLTRYRAEQELEGLQKATHALQTISMRLCAGGCGTHQMRASAFNVGEGLWDVLKKSLTLLDVPLNRVSPDKITYGTQLLDRLALALASIQADDNAEDQLVGLLLRYNLNSASFFRYCVGTRGTRAPAVQQIAVTTSPCTTSRRTTSASRPSWARCTGSRGWRLTGKRRTSPTSSAGLIVRKSGSCGDWRKSTCGWNTAPIRRIPSAPRSPLGNSRCSCGCSSTSGLCWSTTPAAYLISYAATSAPWATTG